VTLTFDLLTSKSNQFIAVTNWTYVENGVKFPQVVCTYAHAENRMIPAASHQCTNKMTIFPSFPNHNGFPALCNYREYNAIDHAIFTCNIIKKLTRLPMINVHLNRRWVKQPYVDLKRTEVWNHHLRQYVWNRGHISRGHAEILGIKSVNSMTSKSFLSRDAESLFSCGTPTQTLRH